MWGHTKVIDMHGPHQHTTAVQCVHAQSVGEPDTERFQSADIGWADGDMPEWSFITKHGLILAVIARRLGVTAREIGDGVCVTERAAHRIIKDLAHGGYVTKTRTGRQTRIGSTQTPS